MVLASALPYIPSLRVMPGSEQESKEEGRGTNIF